LKINIKDNLLDFFRDFIDNRSKACMLGRVIFQDDDAIRSFLKAVKTLFPSICKLTNDNTHAASKTFFDIPMRFVKHLRVECRITLFMFFNSVSFGKTRG
jgi:hypothetical protein